jgi:DNA-directed RNA polymerase alpha subunit
VYYSGYQQQERNMHMTFQVTNISEVRKLQQLLSRLLAPEATPRISPIKGDSIGELGLSTKAFNALISANITQISQLMMLKDPELLAIPNVGKAVFCEIKDSLVKALQC